MNRNNGTRYPPRSRNKRNAQNAVSTAVKINQVVSPSPPMFNVSQHYVCTLRFRATAAVNNYSITPQDIVSSMLVATSVAGEIAQAAAIWSRYKLKYVEAWAIPSTLANAATVIISYGDPAITSSVNTEQTMTDSSASVSTYAHVKLKPKLTSSAAQFQNSTSETGGFVLTLPPNAILDVCVHAYLNNNDPVNIISVGFITPAPTPVVGMVFMKCLDAIGSGSGGTLEPFGYVNNKTDIVTPTPRV